VRIAASRIRLTIFALGCAVLSASLFDWAQTLRVREEVYSWVQVDTSSAPAVETAEIWQAQASCTRPYFVRAVLQSKSKLKLHYDHAPEQVRAWQKSQPSHELQASPHLVSTEDDRGRRSSVEMEYDATLHAQYAEWYAALFRLKMEENQWEQRLDSVANQRVVLSDTSRRNFVGHSPADAKGEFEHYVLYLLGLGSFSDDVEYALKSDCVHVTPIKKILTNAKNLGEIWSWPIDRVAAFSFGLELILVGMLLVPISLWITTGNSRIVKRYVRYAAKQSARRLRELLRKSVRLIAYASNKILILTRSFFKALMTFGLSHSNSMHWHRRLITRYDRL
jgi:hypothetical protein